MAQDYGMKKLSADQQEKLLHTLETRFKDNMHRHANMEWESVASRLHEKVEKISALFGMEETGGEPDVIEHDPGTGEYVFYDCASESPKGRRRVCYDREALESRKKHKPEHNAMDMAAEMGIDLLTETQYQTLQQVESVDNKTSSWLKTPSDVRERGGAIFGDYRYGRVFIYHNSASSYYGVRGFRGSLRV